MRRMGWVVGVFALLGACAGGDGGAKPAATAAATATTAAVAAATSPSSASVDIKEFQFQAQTVTVTAGATVTWTNRDGFAHSVKPESDGFAGSPPALAPGASYAFTFAKAGTYPYICGIHNSMTGTVVVT